MTDHGASPAPGRRARRGRVTASGEVVVHRPHAAVADYVLDPTNLAQWRGEPTAVRPAGTDGPQVGARYRVRVPGRRDEVMRTDEVVALTPLERMALRTVAGGPPLTLDVRVSPEGPGSTLVRATVEGVAGGRAGLLAPIAARAARRALSVDLARLKTVLELPR